MTRLLKSVVLLAAVGLLTVVLVNLLPMRSMAAAMLSRVVAAQTGQRLGIAGDLRLTLSPGPVVVAEHCDLAAAGANAPWLQVERVEVRLSSDALWHGRIEAVAIRLDGARIHLIQGAEAPGRRVVVGNDAAPAGFSRRSDPDPDVLPMQPPSPGNAVGTIPNQKPHWLAALPRDGIELMGATLSWEDPTAGRRLVLGAIDAQVTVQNGQVRIDHRVGDLYSGHLAGTLDVVPSDGAPRLILEDAATDVQLGPLLADLTGHGALTGRADFALSLTSAAADLHTLVGTLDGKGSLHLREGALIGIDPPAMIEAAATSLRGRAVSVPAPESDQKVVLTDLVASAELHAGVLRSEDLKAQGPWLDATGSGSLDLTDGRLDWRLVPVLKRPPEGRGLKELEGVPIPVYLSGTLEAPLWRVDVVAALAEAGRRQGAGEGGDLLNKLERRTGIKGLGTMLRGLLSH